MTSKSYISRHNQRFLQRAFLLSIFVHAVVAVIQLNSDRPVDEPAVTLTVKLEPAKPVEPVAPVVAPPPEPVKPPPPPPPPKPTVVPKPSTPSPVQAPAKVDTPSPIAPVVTEESSPVTATIIASEQKVEAPVKVAPPEPSPPVDTQHERSQYGALLASEIAKHKQYPILAKKTRQQGNVILQLQITSLGQLIAAQVYQSSGYELLDKQAMEMVKKATPFSHPPSTLGERDLTLLVPVSFRLN